jgi:hypothetical protein
MTIWIDQATNLRVNINAPYKGRSRLDTAEIRAELGVIEIQADEPPQEAKDNPDYYTRGEDWETTQRPYITYTRKSDEQIAQVMVAKAKVQRQATVDVIIVTTASGKAFDGDETSQGRMSRAINALDPLETTVWILADNTPTMVTREELREALRLAGAAQTAVWAAPYQL